MAGNFCGFGGPKPYTTEVQYRKRVRLKNYDYRWTGFYFVTVCVAQRLCSLGEVEDGRFVGNAFGAIARACWGEMPVHEPKARLDAFCVMPNHVHGIIYLESPYLELQPRAFGSPQKGALPTVVGGYKSAVTRHINRLRPSPGEGFWQKGYYEHIIRDETSLERIRRYIETNPTRWADDQLHPQNPSKW